MNKVKYYRLISGLLLKDLSEKTGLSVGHLSHIENGNKQPSKSAMESIAFAVGSTVPEAFLHTIRNPDGSVKEAVDQVKVSVTFDNGITVTKTRRKGKTTYTHSAFPTAWEKAEIPPEIKETLGLVKQQYGDFETCLNFAFQLDAPFMLSESASVGAKVLGKLAGTEIVDKSISEVNKKTHQTRSDISYADKQIGEIDVSLTEYFDLDRFDAELKIAEAAFTKLKEDQSRHVTLTALMNSYQLNTEQRIKYYDEVERLAGVVVASVSLGIAEREQAKKEKLEDLNAGFWKAVQDQNEPLMDIKERIEKAKERLEAAKNAKTNFYVPANAEPRKPGHVPHDDLVMALFLLMRAARNIDPNTGKATAFDREKSGV